MASGNQLVRAFAQKKSAKGYEKYDDNSCGPKVLRERGVRRSAGGVDGVWSEAVWSEAIAKEPLPIKGEEGSQKTHRRRKSQDEME